MIHDDHHHQHHQHHHIIISIIIMMMLMISSRLSGSLSSPIRGPRAEGEGAGGPGVWRLARGRPKKMVTPVVGRQVGGRKIGRAKSILLLFSLVVFGFGVCFSQEEFKNTTHHTHTHTEYDQN
jgi:hypothetical protein